MCEQTYFLVQKNIFYFLKKSNYLVANLKSSMKPFANSKTRFIGYTFESKLNRMIV